MARELGILMLETGFPRIPGDIGNPATFNFPIRRKYVESATPSRVVLSSDPSLLEPFIEAARQLEREGVSAITTSCGFLGIFQEELADNVSVPVFTSSLMLGRLIAPMLKKDQKLGILTVNEKTLSDRHLKGAGISDAPLVIQGVADTDFAQMFVHYHEGLRFEYHVLERIMVDAALKMQREYPEVGAILLECTNMPPFANAMRLATGLPIYSAVSQANFIMSGCV